MTTCREVFKITWYMTLSIAIISALGFAATMIFWALFAGFFHR